MLYSNTTHQAGVYGAHGVRCANVLCAPVLSLVEHIGAVYDDKLLHNILSLSLQSLVSYIGGIFP